MFKVKVEISDELTKTIARWRDAPKAAMGLAVYAGAQRVMTAAVARAPRDQGGLDATAYVMLPRSTGLRSKVEGGFGASWAMYVHERMDLPHPHGGEAKYLTRALDAGALQFLTDVAAMMDLYLARGLPPRPTGQFPVTTNAGMRERHSQSSAARRAIRRGRR